MFAGEEVWSFLRVSDGGMWDWGFLWFFVAEGCFWFFWTKVVQSEIFVLKITKYIV